jgi:L-asparaginase
MFPQRTKHGWVLKPAENVKQFLRLIKAEQEVKKIAEIDFFSLMSKDSTNMVPADWTAMAVAVHRRLAAGYDGFVIAHGTDTMHFSASALAFAFGPNLNLPIVFTGAQAIPDVPHGDARVNLLRAVQVASQKFSEVVVAFGDFVFRGCRVQKKDEKRFDAFESPAEFPLGYITEEIVLGPAVRRPKPNMEPIKFKPHFADGIVQISLIPGLQPEVLEPILKNPDCKGIVLQSFGAGNVPNAGKYSFKRFIRTASEMGKPVVIASQFPANSTLASNYEPGVEAVKAGAIPTGNMTNAAATVKFRWVMHQINNDEQNSGLSPQARLKLVHQMMNANYVDEITELKMEKHTSKSARGKNNSA